MAFQLCDIQCAWLELRRCVVSERYCCAALEGFHYEGALDGRYVVDGAEYVEHEVAVVVHIGCHNLDRKSVV